MYVLLTCQSHYNHIHIIVDLIKLQPTHAGTVITFLTRIFCVFLGHQVNSDQKVKNGLHLQHTRDTSPNKYLSVQKLRAVYAPKKQEIKNNKATVLLPRVSNTSLSNDNTRSCTSSPRKQEQEQESISTAPYLSSPRKLLNSHDDNRVKKIYLSETHSGMITGIPCAPPSTPTVGM